MSDLFEISHAASEAATPPDFNDLRQRGLRRRKGRRTAWAGSAAIAVAGVIALAQLPGADPVPSPAPPVAPRETSPTPTHVSPSGDVDPAEIVDDPAARLVQLALDPADPDAMAALWECHEGCATRGAALALTSDGFRTRTVAKVHGDGVLAALGDGAFNYRSGLGVGEVHRVADVTAPSGRGVPVSTGSGLRSWVSMASDGSTHPIEHAEDYGQIVRSLDGGLTAVGVDDSGQWVVARSSDEGASWERNRLQGSAPAPLFSIVPSAGGPALLESGDGATLTPLVASWRLDASGRWVRFAAPSNPRAYEAGQVVLPDGRMFTAVALWSDARPGELGTEPGFFVSDGDDWSVLDRQDSPFPFDHQPVVLATSVSSSAATMVVADPQGDPGEAYQSVDGGRTWTPLTTR